MDLDVLQTFAKASKTNYEEVFLSKETGWSQIQPEKADLNKIHEHYTTPPPKKNLKLGGRCLFPPFPSSLFTVGVCKQGGCLRRERKEGEEGQKKFSCVGRRKSATASKKRVAVCAEFPPGMRSDGRKISFSRCKTCGNPR